MSSGIFTVYYKDNPRHFQVKKQTILPPHNFPLSHPERSRLRPQAPRRCHLAGAGLRYSSPTHRKDAISPVRVCAIPLQRTTKMPSHRCALFLSRTFCSGFSHLFQLCSVFPGPDSPSCHNPPVYFLIFAGYQQQNLVVDLNIDRLRKCRNSL